MNMQTLGWPTERPLYADPQLRLIAAAALTEDDRAAWDRLAGNAEPGSVFSHRWFLEPLLAEEGRVLAVVEEEPGQWVGAMALDQVERLGRLPVPLWQGVKDANQFLGTPLIHKGSALSFWHYLLSGLEAHAAGPIGLYVPAIPQDSGAGTALRAISRDTGRRLEVIRTSERAAFTGGADFEAHITGHVPAKRRARLASLARQLEADLGPLQLLSLDGPDLISAWIDDFLTLEKAGWKGKTGSAMGSTTQTEQLFRSAVSGAASHGLGQCLTLKAGDVSLAHSVQFIEGSFGCGFKTCYDERYARYAPGLHLLLCITKLISRQPGLQFDSCSTPNQASINGLWPDRVTINDYCVGFRGNRKSAMFDAMMAVRKLWHQGKGLV